MGEISSVDEYTPRVKLILFLRSQFPQRSTWGEEELSVFDQANVLRVVYDELS